MKKIFAFLAIATMFAVACSKPADNKPADKPNEEKPDDQKPDDQKPDDQKPGDDYAGPVEGSSEWSLIGALLDANWDKDYVAAKDGDIYVVKNVKLAASDQFKFRKDKDWAENRGATGDVEPFVVTTGTALEVVHNGKNLAVSADGIYDIYYNAAKEQMCIVAKDGTPTWAEGGQGGGEIKSIAIDGTFEDWAALEKGTYSQTFGDEEAPCPALTHCKVYATAEKVYVYVEWDMEYITDLAWVPFHCYINTDGNESTGGYADQFSDACSDILLEGAVYADGEICSYWVGGYPWVGEPNAAGWGWAPDTDNVFGEESPTEGAGVDGKYEFSIDRQMMADAGYPIADEFSIGFDIQQSWESVGILPSTSPSEDNANGILPSLKVKTIK